MIILMVLFLSRIAVSLTTISPNPLANIPGQPGPHIAQISALADNEWLNLGAPAADPRWGRARGCAWGGKSMVLAPNLRGAFRTGEGLHAYVKPDGFGQDDYWFYDINGHRWICLYPGTDTARFTEDVKEGVIQADSIGRVVDRDGQPIPGHQFIHAWGSLTYDTDRELFVWFGDAGYSAYYFPGTAYNQASDVREGLALLDSQGLSNWEFQWNYNPLTGRFEQERTGNKIPNLGSHGQKLYIPSRKEFFAAAGNGVAYFNPVSNTWGPHLKDSSMPQDWTYDFGACHESKRDRIYMGQYQFNFYWYEIASGKWNKVTYPESRVDTFNIRGNSGSVVYDSINDMVLLFDYKRKLIVPIDPETNVFGIPIPFSPTFVPKTTNAAFYDPALGTIFIYTAGDSEDNGVMWVYSYKRGHTATEVSVPKSDALRISADPNPFRQQTVITLKGTNRLKGELDVYSIDGKKVVHCIPFQGSQSHEIQARLDGSSLSAGVYIAVYRQGLTMVRKPITLMK